MAVKRFSVRFFKLPVGSVFFIDWTLTSQAGPAAGALFELTTEPVSHVGANGQLTVPVGVGCAGRLRIPITGSAPKGTVEFRVENSEKTTIRRTKHDLATLGLVKGDLYVCRCDGEPVLP